MKLSSIAQDVKTSSIEVTVADKKEKVDFAFFPNAFTPKAEADSKASRNSDLAGDILIGLLLPLLAWIDIEDDAGKKIAITKEGLSVLPIAILNDLMGKINDEITPGKTISDESAGSFKA